MSDTKPADAGEQPKTLDPSDPDFESLKEMRAIEKEKDRAKLRSTVSELQSQLDSLLAEKKKAEEQKAREAQDWTTLEKGLLAEKQELQSQLQALQEQLVARETNDRKATFLERVAAEAGVENNVMFRGAMREIAELEDIDLAPEKVDERRLKAVQALLRKHAPALFIKTQAKPSSPPDSQMGSGEKDWRAIAAAVSHGGGPLFGLPNPKA